jgi:alpha-L-rhamnosidase
MARRCRSGRLGRSPAHGRCLGVRDLLGTSAGGYRDNLVGGEVGPVMSEHTNAAAVCAGLVRPDKLVRVRDLLLDREKMVRSALFARIRAGTSPHQDGSPDDLAAMQHGRLEPDWDVSNGVVAAQPFFRYVVHDALGELGAAGEIARLCRDWEALLSPDATTWRETWEGGSYCHGWSSTPTRDLVTYTLGITPAEPGYGRVRVAPRPGDLRLVRGAVPTPHGLVTVEVRGDEVAVESPVPVELVDLSGQVLTIPPAGSTAN